MTFVCQCCGDCCSTMGEIISIREQVRSYEFRIGYTDGEECVVSVDPDKRVLFDEQYQEEKNPWPVPFSGSGHPMNASARCMPAGLNSAGTTSVPVSSFSVGMEIKQSG